MKKRPGPAPRAPRLLAPLGLPLGDVSKLYGFSRTNLSQRIQSGTLPVVRVSARRLIVLDGDHEVLRGEDARGLATIDAAGSGCSVLRLPEVATALDVCLKTVEVLASDGELPTFRDELGRRLVAVSDFRAWLRERRKPARWESQTRRRAS